MSFFRTANDSDSDSESEEELLSSSDDDGSSTGGLRATKTKKPKAGSDDSDEELEDSDDDDDARQKAAPAKGPSRFLRGGSSDSDDSDDERGRIVKSAKNKRADEMDQSAKRVENAVKIDDWSSVNTEFDKLTRLVTGNPSTTFGPTVLPPVYLALVVSLDESLNEAAAKKKKLNATHNRALNGMKQKIKKTLRDSDTTFAKYKADPEAFQREFEGADAPATDAVPKPKKSKKARIAAAHEDDEAFETVGKGGKALNLTPDGVFKTLAAVLEARGKKATDRGEQTKTLEKLLQIAPSPYARLRVLLALTSSVFDYSTSTHAYMPIETWTVARSKLDELLTLLEAEAQYRIQEEVAEYDEEVERLPESSDPSSLVLIRGSILSLVERLDDEFTRSLKDIDPHATEYVERLKDEKAVYEVVVRAQRYFERCAMREHLERILMRRLEHVYSKPDAVITALQGPAATGSPADLIHEICVALYKPDTDARLRARALLCHVFHYAQRGDYYRARDMLLMSHIHHVVASADVETQIMYNRAIAQLGLSAFRSGLIEECESTLRDLYSNATFVRERLAQGTARRMGDAQPTPEQEKLEKARQLPFHQHINLELLEVAYLVASMLVEVPQIALEMYDPERKRDVKSRMFRRSLDYHEKQIFAGPPENKRDHVVQAAKALQQGDWRRCVELINSIKVWSLLADEKAVKALLERKIREEGLRTYIFSHAPFYSTISLEYLATTFSLPQTTVAALTSTLIWHELLSGSLDAKSGMLHLHSPERTALQQMALALADKAGQMLNENERTATAKLGDGESGGGGGGKADGSRPERDGNAGHRGERRGGSSRGGRGFRGGASFAGTMGRAVRV